jgi:hypothetical protein
MARRPFPHAGKMKRVLRVLQAAGEVMERVEVHGDDFVVVLAKPDTPPQSEIVASDGTARTVADEAA